MAPAVGAWAEPGPEATTQSVATPAAAMSTVRGVVKSVSGTRLSMETGQQGSGAEIQLVLDERTVFTKRGKAGTAKDLRAGDPVTVSYTKKDGKAVARRVWVSAAAAGGPPGGTGGSRGR